MAIKIELGKSEYGHTDAQSTHILSRSWAFN